MSKSSISGRATVLLYVSSIVIAVTMLIVTMANGDGPEPTFLIKDPIGTLRVSRVRTKIETTWTTTGRKYPDCKILGCLVVHHTICFQDGMDEKITYIEITWKGEVQTHELERERVSEPGHQKREVSCDDEGGFLGLYGATINPAQ